MTKIVIGLALFLVIFIGYCWVAYKIKTSAPKVVKPTVPAPKHKP